MVTWSQQETLGCCLAIMHSRDVTAEQGLVVMLSIVHFWGLPALFGAGPDLKVGWTGGAASPILTHLSPRLSPLT